MRQIGQVVDAIGLSPRTIGHYDEAGRPSAMSRFGRLRMYAAVAEERVPRLQEELRIAADFAEAPRQEASRRTRARARQ